ncbi:hypothetical protein CKAH01_03893 [Colletotrichum kahawae]|uniref:DUF2235 domain-containing protein n=1 Tax=Colletotrichum kahawae TaxID=34407 RepID=A0AAD9YMX9_COLKA|nr:hypothetical protein CKAH01_03893 [Colletotrichum kahawae]
MPDHKSCKRFLQQKHYFDGIKFQDIGLSIAGAFGPGLLDQIRDVYRKCCRLSGPQDEIWLYGFGRGAYVVHAVTGLLRHVRALTSADRSDREFKSDYDKALKEYRKMQRKDRLGEAQILPMATRAASTIQLLGLFDMVTAVSDDNSFDIPFNSVIRNFRHALALNETTLPEHIFHVPPFTTNHNLQRRTAVQAWFVGGHIDIGGSSAKDGLSLYPLQWMVTESRKLGLKLGSTGLSGGQASLTDAIELTGLSTHATPWRCTTENGITFEMADIQELHKTERYSIHLSLKGTKGRFQKQRIRAPFDSDDRQGTAIHPSVYLLLDRHIGIGLDMQTFPFYKRLEGWRYKTLGQNGDLPNSGFWNDAATQDYKDFGALRILVCGNTGVGKSSLINKVFGVPEGEEVTPSCDNVRGEHNVQEGITWPGRPDLVIHDSRGFEAAGIAELEAVKEFLREKQRETEINKRLHAIWFCLEVNNRRPIQRATQDLFRIIKEHADDIPVIVIATKKDEFEAIQCTSRVTSLRRQGQQATFEDMVHYAREQLDIRLEELEGQIVGMDDGRFDVCVAVSKDDEESIQNLVWETAECFSHDKVRLLYIRAQVARLDLKINLALERAMHVYKNVLRRSTLMAGLPATITTNWKSGAINLCEAIISCFGIPGVSGKTAFEVYGRNVFDENGNSYATAAANAIATASIISTGVLAGIPIFLFPAVANVPLVVPATSRLMLMLSCDLILIFSRAFKEASANCNSQPQLADLEKAATAYRAYSQRVHARVRALVPSYAKGIKMCYRNNDIKLGIKEILQDSRHIFAGDTMTPEPASRDLSDSAGSLGSQVASSEDTIIEDMRTVEQTCEEMQERTNDTGTTSSLEMHNWRNRMREVAKEIQMNLVTDERACV